MPDQNYSEPNLEQDTDHELLFKAAYAQWLIEQGGGGGGSGTVTSVGLSLPSIFTVSGSPVTTAGTLTGELATQAANTVFAGPTTGANAAPAFRALVNADIPSPGNTGNVLFTEAGLMTATDDMNYDTATGEFQLGGNSVPGSVFLRTAGGLQPEIHFQNINSGITTLQPGISGSNFTSTLPSSDGILLNENGTNTLTNKTISGASNTITNIPAASIAAGTLAANLTLGEGAGNLLLDTTLSADGTYSGILQSGTAGATLAFGDLCYFSVTDSRWELADASAASTSGSVMLGICVLAAAADGDPTTMLLWGKVRADTAFPSFTVGAPVYVSETAGDLTGTQPTTTDAVIRVCGFAQTADSIWFTPSGDYLTHV